MGDNKQKDYGIGDIIQGNLKLKEVIGEGATGLVFLAEHVNLVGKKNAVKRLDKEHMEQIDFEDYKREIIFMKKLSGHPNIVQYINNFETPNYFYLVLEHCETDLFDAIFLRCGFPPALVKRFFSDIASGLDYAHKNGIYHRDIKPENVLITSDGGQAKLADFGLATMDKFSDEFGVGSARYLAPECLGKSQDGGEDIDFYCSPAADVWALGVLLINMIFGRNPWHEASLSDPVFNAYINTDPNILMRNLKITEQLDYFLRHKRDDDNHAPFQIEFISDGDKVNIIQNPIDPKSCFSSPQGSQVLFRQRQSSFTENDFNVSFSSSMNLSVAAHIGSLDGFGLLKMSSNDIATPFMETKESRIQLVKRIGASSFSSMDRIASVRNQNKKSLDKRSKMQQIS